MPETPLRPSSVTTQEDLDLLAAGERKVRTKNCEDYFRDAFEAWKAQLR